MEAISKDRQAAHAELPEPLEHLAGDLARDHRLLQRIAIDEHGSSQGLEARITHRVEETRLGPAQVGLTGGDRTHDLLLCVRREVPPGIDDLDAKVATGQLVDPPDEVLDDGRGAQSRIHGHPQYDRLAPTAGLVPARRAAGATRRHDGHHPQEGEGPEPAVCPHRDPYWPDHQVDLVYGKPAYAVGPMGGSAA